MQKDIISVILPIYNAEKTLKRCVHSIEKQTYSNLQIILVDDGSTDNSWKICKQLKEIDSRITIATQPNSGVSVARNKGLKIACGKWVMFIDPDDMVDANIIATLLANVNTKRDIIACSCYGIDKSEKIRAHFFNGNRVFNVDKDDLYLQLLDSGYKQTSKVFTAIGVPWGKIYRREFLEKNNLRFNPKLRRMQDNIFNMYAFYYANSIFYLDQPLYYYHLDHIKQYSKRHLSMLDKIFIPLVSARFECLNKLGLYNNSKIHDKYVNEASNFFIEIIKSLIVSSKNSKIFRKEVSELTKKEYFKDIFGRKEIKKINNRRLKTKIILIKLKMYKFVRASFKVKLWINKGINRS